MKLAWCPIGIWLPGDALWKRVVKKTLIVVFFVVVGELRLWPVGRAAGDIMKGACRSMIRSSLIQAHKTTPIRFGVSRLASYNSWSPVKLVAVSQSQDNHIHSIELLALTGKLASHPPHLVTAQDMSWQPTLHPTPRSHLRTNPESKLSSFLLSQERDILPG